MYGGTLRNGAAKSKRRLRKGTAKARWKLCIYELEKYQSDTENSKRDHNAIATPTLQRREL